LLRFPVSALLLSLVLLFIILITALIRQDRQQACLVPSF
jgi:hypothetical protein